MKKIIFMAILVLLASCVSYGVHFQGKTASDFVSDVTKNGNWSETRRQKDPEGYSRFVEKRLKDGISKYEELRKQLGESSVKLQKEISDRQEKLAKSEAFLEQTLAALDKGEYPAELFGMKYDEEQLRSQVATLMSEQESYQNAIETLTKARKDADQEIRSLIAQITENENQLTTIEHNRKLFVSRKTTSECKELVEDLAKAFDSNDEFEAVDPVGSLDALVQRANAYGAKPNADEDRVDSALAEYRARQKSSVVSFIKE